MKLFPSSAQKIKFNLFDLQPTHHFGVWAAFLFLLSLAGILLLSMERQDVISILVTFAVGFLGGGYLYVGHFAKMYGPDAVATQEAAQEFSITGEAYGSCDTACPAFQLQKNGSYRYRYTATQGEAAIVRDGTLPLDIQRSVKRALDADVLEEESQTIDAVVCNSSSDGIDIRYRISYEGEEYEIDSCGTAVNDEGELWSSLNEIWGYLQTVR